MVFKGIIFDVWQWEQEMFDGSTQTFERLKRPNTAQVIPIVGEKILIQIEEQPDARHPFPSIPGGRFDEGEDSLAAAKRELLEETGYVSDDWTLWKEVDPVGKIEWTVFTYIARNCVLKGETQLDAGEKITTRLIDFEEFLALADDPLFYSPEMVPDLLRMRLDQNRKDEFKKFLFAS
jgi:8-oxo-dGTP pyrophosphatase MutT (NUDIX family)